MEPEMKLLSMEKSRSDIREVKMSSESWPLRRLSSKDKDMREVRLANDIGTLPVNELLSSVSTVKFRKAPSEEGREPENRLEANNILRM